MDEDESAALLEELLAARKAKGGGEGGGLRGRAGLGWSEQEPFAIAGIVLGLTSLGLNLLVLGVLVAQRRLAFRHVFYLLVLSFTLIDAIKGASLVMFSTIKTIDLTTPKTSAAPISLSQQKILVVKIEQVTLFVLRFTNLSTILNVLLITLNEFLYIKFPLRYGVWVRRRRAVVLICLAWLFSLAFTLATTLARSQKPTFVIGPCKDSSRSLSHDPSATSTATSANRTSDTMHKNCFYKTGAGNSMAVHNMFMLALISFCLGCLVVVWVCYTVTFTVIYRLQRADAALRAEARRSSEGRDLAARDAGDSPDRRYSHVSDSVALGALQSPDPDSRRIRSHILRRHKYVLVIGSVIAVYSLYLLSYTTIQILQFRRLSSKPKAWKASSFVVQWSMQLLVGLHAVFQPLCYFRIKELRRFAKRTFRPLCPVAKAPPEEGRSTRASSAVQPTELQLLSPVDPGQRGTEASERLLGTSNGASPAFARSQSSPGPHRRPQPLPQPLPPCLCAHPPTLSQQPPARQLSYQQSPSQLSYQSPSSPAHPMSQPPPPTFLARHRV